MFIGNRAVLGRAFWGAAAGRENVAALLLSKASFTASMSRSFMKSLAIIAEVLFMVLAVTCTGKAPPANFLATLSSTPGSSIPFPSGKLPLRTLRDVPLMGAAS